MTAPITIQPVLVEDSKEISRVESAAFSEDLLSIAAFGPNRASPERQLIRAAAIEKDLSKASSHMAKAVTPDGMIAGVAEWGFFPQGRPDEEWNKENEWPEGANTALCTYFFGLFRTLVKKLVDGKPFASLNILVVSPDYQRMGVGAMLIREGLEKADEAGLPAVLGATPKGIGLYRKMGFMDWEVVDVDLRPFGIEASLRHVIMIRPAGKVAETA